MSAPDLNPNDELYANGGIADFGGVEIRVICDLRRWRGEVLFAVSVRLTEEDLIEPPPRRYHA